MEAAPEGVLRREKVEAPAMRELPDARGDERASPIDHGLSDAPCHPGGGPADSGPRPGQAPAIRATMELEG
eukprot:8547171-Alexandrium_andersonii.AAC.1